MTAPNRMSLGVDGVVGATGIEPVTLPSDPITVAGEPVGGALPAAITGPTQQGLTDIAASQPRAPGAYLGHGPGDSKGQQRYRAVSRDPALSSGEGSEQPCSWRHAVYGMQGVRGSNPLSSTTTSQQVTGLPFSSAALPVLVGLPDSCHPRATRC
jgi:hypothetical protein